MTIDPVSGVSAVLRLESSPGLSSIGGPGAGKSVQSGAAQLLNSAEITPPGVSSDALAIPGATSAELIPTAALAAALRQGGLAVLMADLAQAQHVSGLPAPVQAAINQVLGLRAPLDAPPTAADIKAALTQSDLSSPALEAGAPAVPGAALAAAASPLAGGAITGALLGLQQELKSWLDTAPAEPTPPPASVPASSLPASRQDGSAPASSDVAPAPRANNPSPPLQPGIAQPPGTQSTQAASAPVRADINAGPAQPNQSAETARAAAALPTAASASTVAPLPSGTNPGPAAPPTGPVATILADGRLAQPAPVPAAATTQPAEETLPSVASGATFKSALPPTQPAGPSPLVTAPEAAANQAATAVAVLAQAQAISSAGPGPALGQAMQIFQQVFKSWFDAAPANSSSAASDAAPAAESSSTPASASAPSNAPPPPPYRGGPTTAQPPVLSTLPLHADPITVGNQLTRETTAALAHQELLGIASLPTQAPGQAPGNGQVAQWMFEIPFATPQGSAVAQFKISRDAARASNGRLAPMWRADFSLDVEPMGPVHAQIALSGDRSWVSLWAEREESVTQLRGQQPLLSKALKDSDFVAEIAIHVGAPHQPAPSNGQFLDHQS